MSPLCESFRTADQIDEMPQRATQPIQTPDHQRVLAVAQLFQHPLKLRPFAQRPGRGIAKAPGTPGAIERIELERDVLVAG